MEGQSLHPLGAVRELRPSEDLSLMHAYELRTVFELAVVSALKLVERRSDESFHLVAAPLAAEPMRAAANHPAARPIEIAAPSAAVVDATPAVRVGAAQTPGMAPEPPAAAEPRRHAASGHDGTAVAVASAAEPLPYGFDPVRVRELVEGLIDIRAASAMVFVPRAAGDLVDVPSHTDEAERRLASVLPSERTTG